MRVFVLWDDTGVLKLNPHRHWEDRQHPPDPRGVGLWASHCTKEPSLDLSSKISVSGRGLVYLLQLEFAAIPLRWTFPVIIGPLSLFINLFLKHCRGFHSPAPTTHPTEENLVSLLIYDLLQSLVTMLHRCSHLEVAGKRKRLCFKHSDRVNTAELSQQAAITVRMDSLTARFFLPPKVSHLLSLFLLMTSIVSNKAAKSSILL